MLKRVLRKCLIAAVAFGVLWFGAALVGRNDEAFHADRFASVVSLHHQGETVVIEGETHDSIVHSSAALRTAAEWVRNVPRTVVQNIGEGK